ncbi:MAG: recombinase family protein [Clostridium sp.]|nr:recombinase family protein [Clostridium sp.]
MERVGIYNRCSTEEESQKNALAAQAAESREIAARQGWEITEQYIESETGTVAYKRGGYQRLLEDMERDKFDIVMIKSIDRLMRSAKDWYIFLGRLTANGLRLYIYIERKFYTPDDNLISGIKAILAEDFSRELSKKIKNAHRRRQEKKSGCNITCGMFGWNRIAKDTYEINEKEAEYYRRAFALAGEGRGFYTISNLLYEEGARGRSGQKISEVQWRNMLYTPRAHGTMVLNKRIYNFDAKRYEQTPEKDWIFVENALPPIVSKEYQEEVITILKKRALLYGQQGKSEACMAVLQGKYELSRKLVCAQCGKFYYRTGGRKNAEGEALWKCSTFLGGGRSRNGENPVGCDNRNLRQKEVFDALAAAFRESFPELYGRQGELLGEFLRFAEKVLETPGEEDQLKGLERERGKLKARGDFLMEKFLDGIIGDEDFQRYRGEAAEKLREIEQKIESIKSRQGKYNNYESRLREIEKVLTEERLIERGVTAALLERTESITVHGDGRLEVCLEAALAAEGVARSVAEAESAGGAAEAIDKAAETASRAATDKATEKKTSGEAAKIGRAPLTARIKNQVL